MFLFYDTSICRKTVWLPTGTESLPRIAECSLGVTGTYGVVSGIIFLLCLILVCLKAPERRDLEPDYGLDVENGFIESRNINMKDSSFDSDSEQDQYTVPPIGGPGFYPNEEDGESEFTMNSRGYDSGYESSTVGHNGVTVTHEIRDNEDDLLLHQRINSVDHGDDDDKYNPRKPPAIDVTIIRNRSDGNRREVSRSRLETVQRMEKNTRSDDSSTLIIDELLSELDKSFNVNEN
jgi:hypothetical protein